MRLNVFSFRTELSIQWVMATLQDKFNNTKPLVVEEMNKTSFGRWMAETHSEASYLFDFHIFWWWLIFDHSGQLSHQFRAGQTCQNDDQAVLVWVYFCWGSSQKGGWKFLWPSGGLLASPWGHVRHLEGRLKDFWWGLKSIYIRISIFFFFFFSQ